MNPGRPLENAVLYKDLTQWFRSRAFLALFFGLLVISLGIYGAAFFSHAEARGENVLGPLFILLLLYCLAIATASYNLTRADILGGSFELFELAGLTPSGIVRGKLHSLLLRFFFGFFCVAPFFMLGYFLGGVDPREMAVIFSFVCCAAFFVFLLSLTLAFTVPRKAGTAVSITILATLLVWGDALRLDFPDYRYSPVYFFLYWGYSLLIFNTVCAFLYCLCCHSIGRRQGIYLARFRLTAVLLSVLLMAETLLAEPYDPAYLGFLPLLPLWPFFLCFGLGFPAVFGSFSLPAMAARAAGEARGRLRRAYLFVFGPGPEGAFRTVFLLWLTGCGYVLNALFLDLSPGAEQAVLVAPFFIAFPGSLFFLDRAFRKRRRMIVLFVLLFWGFIYILGALSGGLPDPDDFFRHYGPGLGEGAIRWALMCIPLSGGLAESQYEYDLAFAGMALGALCMVFLAALMYIRTRPGKEARA